jgi:tetratricopeptide (TPR) repeat protein
MSLAHEPSPTAFSQTVQLLLDNHRLIREGKGDSPEALDVSSAMEKLWYSLTEEQQELLGGLSEDLYSLDERRVTQVALSPEDRRRYARRAQEIFAQYHQGEYLPALALLRGPLPNDILPESLRFLQARCWEKIGEPEVALLFMKEAERLNPKLAVNVLHLLRKTNRAEETTKYAERLLDAEASSPATTYLAAATLLASAREMEREQARPVLERIIPPLERALEKCLMVPIDQREVPELAAGIASMLGLCLERLGAQEQAMAVYDEGLKHHPRDSTLLTFRALALYDTDPDAALRDFGLAAAHETYLLWPYLFLAHAALIRHDYRSCWAYCLRGLACDAPPQMHALLHEWLGISQSMLGQSPTIVLDNFDQALALDPANARARRNRGIAESRLSRSAHELNNWRIESAATLVTSARSLSTVTPRDRWDEYNVSRNEEVERLLAGELAA